jgi:hypothetical protein
MGRGSSLLLTIARVPMPAFSTVNPWPIASDAITTDKPAHLGIVMSMPPSNKYRKGTWIAIPKRAGNKSAASVRTRA